MVKIIAMERPRLIVDVMLGRLARWLRLLGYDTFYKRDITDAELIRIAKQDHRLILTRDREIFRKVKDQCIFIHSELVLEQLRQVLSLLNEKGERLEPFSRCVNCNTSLEEIKKEEVSGLVPDHIYATIPRFVMCPACKKIYWRGSHEKRIKELLGELI